MTREKILELARELGFIPRHVELDEHWMQVVEAFYHKAQAEAFERAAEMCDLLYNNYATGHDCAAAIREMAKEMK